MVRRTCIFMLVVLFSAMTSAAAFGAESEQPMFDVLINIIRKSNQVLAVRMKGTQPVDVDGEKFVRAAGDVVEVFKGADPPKAVAVDVKFQNRETPRTTAGELYVLFLRRGTDGKEAGRWFLVD